MRGSSCGRMSSFITLLYRFKLSLKAKIETGFLT
jgi:hypothetical protein